MASEAKLLRHHPGTVTSIEIPMNNGSFGEISFKSIVNALVAKSKTEEASSSATSSISAATLPQIPKLKEGRHRSNPYDNIIEKLERKYTSHMIIGDEEGSEEDEEIDEPGEEAGVTDIKTAKKKKKSNPYDAYDLNGMEHNNKYSSSDLLQHHYKTSSAIPHSLNDINCLF